MIVRERRNIAVSNWLVWNVILIHLQSGCEKRADASQKSAHAGSVARFFVPQNKKAEANRSKRA
jgi:hypothetical protein